MTTIGIDPGLSGAIAVLNRDHQLIDVYDMPNHGGWVGADAVRVIVANYRPTHIVIEEVSLRTSQGSALKIGANWGRLHYAIELWPVTILRPQEWSAAVGRPLGLTKPDRKQWSLDRARELWPDMASELARKKDNGRAEAALIALAYLIDPARKATA